MLCQFLLNLPSEPLGDSSWFPQVALDTVCRRSAKSWPSGVYLILWYLQGSEQLLTKPACFSWGSEIALNAAKLWCWQLWFVLLWTGSDSWDTTPSAVHHQKLVVVM